MWMEIKDQHPSFKSRTVLRSTIPWHQNMPSFSLYPVQRPQTTLQTHLFLAYHVSHCIFFPSSQSPVFSFLAIPIEWIYCERGCPNFSNGVSVMLNYSWHWFNKHVLNCFNLPGAQLGTRAGEVDEMGSPHSLKEATKIYPQGNGELGELSPHPKYNFSYLVNCWGLMMSFLDNQNQTQLPRALGTFSSWVWPGRIFSLESHFPLNISPFFFPIGRITVPSCLSLSISPSCLWERSHVSLMCTSWDLLMVPALCHWVKPVKWDNLCANTLSKADMWTLPLFCLHPWRAKAETAFLWDGALSFLGPVCVSMSLSFHHLCWDLTGVPINAKPPPTKCKGRGEEPWKL